MFLDKKTLIELIQGKTDIFPALLEAKKLKESHFGNQIETCAIINAKSGRCPSDCKFCAQAKDYPTATSVYPLLSERELLGAIEKAARAGIDRFSIVTSGIKLSFKELKKVLTIIEKAHEKFPEVKLCASLGQLGRDELKALKEAGLSRYHHNLETAKSFYPEICTKQDWLERLRTAERVKEVELSLCCGGLFGLGETPKHIIEFAETLKNLSPDSIPVNFLHPISGTPLEKASFLTPQKCLAILVVLRFFLPDKEIRVCGGREYNLRDLQALSLFPANALMVGNYLTTRGRTLVSDKIMIKDLGYHANLK